jgi:mycothiol synthase
MDIERLDRVSASDLADVRELLGAAREADDHEPLGEHKWLDLVHGGREGFAGFIAREPDHPHPVGYAHLSAHERTGKPTQWGLELVVHPEHRGIGVELELARHALDDVATRGGGHLHLWVFRPTEIHEGIAHTLGLKRGRELLHMRVPLPVREAAQLPEGTTLRRFEPNQDEETWLEVNNSAFAHHPEQGAWDLDTLRRRMAEPWFELDGFLVAEDTDGMAGFCWVKVDADADTGEIYIVATHPSRQVTGLGKALTVAGMDWKHQNGLGTGTLFGDASNAPAVKLYEKLGFEVHHLDRAYVTDVEAH